MDAVIVAIRIGAGHGHTVVGSDDDPVRIAQNKEVAEIIGIGLSKLEDSHRAVVVLRDVEQMSYAEIADIMKMPEGTVKSYLFRARRMLKDKLLAKYSREEL